MIKALLGNPWALVALFVVGFGAGAYTAHQFSKAGQVSELEAQLRAQKANYDTRIDEYNAKQSKFAALDQVNATLSAQLKDTESRLSAAVKNPTVKFITREATTDAKPCPDTRRAPAFRVCYNAAVLGTAEATAECEAAGGYAGVQNQ